MKESDAIRLAKKFIPTLTDTDAKTIIKVRSEPPENM